MKTKLILWFMLFLFGWSMKIFPQSTFIDDFSGDLSAWTDMYGGNWTIQNNELHGFYTLVCGNIYCHQADLILNDEYQIEGDWKASIDFIRISDDQIPIYYAASAIFSLWTDAYNKIQIGIGRGGDYWGGEQETIDFNVHEWNGLWNSGITTTVDFYWNPDEWHKATLIKQGNVYSLFVDDIYISQYIDNFLNGLGKIGLHTYGTRRLDNFKLEPLNNSSSLIIVSNSIKNNPAFPSPRILWSGNTNDTPSPVKICADGSSATSILIAYNSDINPENIKFQIESDPDENDTDQFGSFPDQSEYYITDNTIKVNFNHPKYLQYNGTTHRNDNIQIIDTDYPDSPIFEIPIEVYRAPVLFVHGIYGDRNTFKSMVNSLIVENYYPLIITNNIDYNKQSDHPFSENVAEIIKGINELINQTRSLNYSAAKVDIVSHSMGGILSRLYLQSNYKYNYRNDVNKLITLNTPHSGSQFANSVEKYLQKLLH